MQETWVQSLSQEYSLEKEMATHSSILAWEIPWTEETGGLQSVGSQRAGHNWVTKHAHTHGYRPWSQVYGCGLEPVQICSVSWVAKKDYLEETDSNHQALLSALFSFNKCWLHLCAKHHSKYWRQESNMNKFLSSWKSYSWGGVYKTNKCIMDIEREQYYKDHGLWRQYN